MFCKCLCVILSENYGKEDYCVKSHMHLKFCNLDRHFKIAFLRGCTNLHSHQQRKTLPFPHNLIKRVSRIWGWLLISQGNGVSAGIWLISLFTRKLQYITWSSPCSPYTAPEALTRSVPWCSEPAIQLHTPGQLYRWFPVPGMLSPPPPAQSTPAYPPKLTHICEAFLDVAFLWATVLLLTHNPTCHGES